MADADSILAGLVHELRTPLASLRLTIEMSRESAEPAETERQRNRVAAVLDEVQAILEDASWFSRLRRGVVPIRTDEFTPREWLDSIEVPRPVGSAAGSVELVSRLEDPAPRLLRTDRELLTRAVSSILSHAVAVSGAGPVSLVLRRRAGCPLIVVRDHGSEVSESDLETLFEPYARVRPVAGRDARPGGLDLACAREVASRLDGRLEAIRHEDGIEFELTLPSRALVD